ncbi:hypothetical protein FNB79_03100 [Formosa sediminum]|uniref:Uncharacterized protein n=1 Tax=Formosa sediminum TaxID=2594004 RepID=A0A516GNQ9_9FLAO|nr:hypothetical protein [Formosa sediminum]QDO93000.1 hypothetical protein FNB79_03100 [Formosa sediminum]
MQIETIQDVLDTSLQYELYGNLVFQLNKDFRLANIDIDVATSILPKDLKVQLHEAVYQLIQHNFAEYLNLLYIIDVPEREIKALDGSDTLKLSEQVAFLILKREWQKVWFKHQYK